MVFFGWTSLAASVGIVATSALHPHVNHPTRFPDGLFLSFVRKECQKYVDTTEDKFLPVKYSEKILDI